MPAALTTLMRITVPAMTPVIVVVFLLAVIRIFSSFETELLLGVPWGFYVYSTKIVDLARQEPPLVNQAAALGSVILLFLAAFIPFQRKLIGRRQFTTVTGQFKPKIIDLGFWRYPATAFVGLVILLLDVVPILSVLGGSFMTRFGFFNLPKTWTLEYWKMALSDPRILQSLQNTLIISSSAAIFGVLVFSVIGYVLVRTKLPGRSILDSICWLPSAIPGVLSGLGLLWMFLGTPFFRPFYGTIVLLVVASVLGGITLSTQILKANFIQLGNELEEASRMSGAGFWQNLLSGYLSSYGANDGAGGCGEIHVCCATSFEHHFAGDIGDADAVASRSRSDSGGLSRGREHHGYLYHAADAGCGCDRQILWTKGRYPGRLTMRRTKERAVEDRGWKIEDRDPLSSILDHHLQLHCSTRPAEDRAQ